MVVYAFKVGSSRLYRPKTLSTVVLAFTDSGSQLDTQRVPHEIEEIYQKLETRG